MIFQHTHPWIFEPSPHTGILKTRTTRMMGSNDVAWSHLYDFRRGVEPSALELHNYYHVVGSRNLEARVRQIKKYEVGKTYAVQPARGAKAIGRIKLLKISLMQPSKTSYEQARAEGFRGVIGYLEKIEEMYGESADLMCFWMLEFMAVRP